jgi:hypothetical protein
VKTPACTPYRESFTWIYGLALLVTVASVDTGVVPYLTTLINNLFGISLDGTKHATILVITVALIVVQTLLNTVGAKVMGLVARMGVYVETVGTFGVAIALGIAGFHHGLGFLFTTHGAAHAASNPLGVDFHGNWLRRGAPSCYESGVFAGRTPGSTRLDAHRLAGHLRVVRRPGHLAEPEVALLPLGQLQQRLDAERVTGHPGVPVADRPEAGRHGQDVEVER